jgi:hypothetical protein
LFDVSPAQLWQPGSNRALLAALLADLRDAHWSRAAGCSPMPLSMTPLNARTAVNNEVTASSLNPHALERAVAAAEKITWLLPHNL